MQADANARLGDGGSFTGNGSGAGADRGSDGERQDRSRSPARVAFDGARGRIRLLFRSPDDGDRQCAIRSPEQDSSRFFCRRDKAERDSGAWSRSSARAKFPRDRVNRYRDRTGLRRRRRGNRRPHRPSLAARRPAQDVSRRYRHRHDRSGHVVDPAGAFSGFAPLRPLAAYPHRRRDSRLRCLCRHGDRGSHSLAESVGRQRHSAFGDLAGSH